MTAVDVDALDKLREAATPGLWLRWTAPDVTAIAAADRPSYRGVPVNPARWIASGTSGLTPEDALLIVAAVNALPDLLAEVRRGRALREAVEKLARKYDQPAEPGPWAEGTRSLYGGGQVAYDLLAVLAATDGTP